MWKPISLFSPNCTVFVKWLILTLFSNKHLQLNHCLETKIFIYAEDYLNPYTLVSAFMYYIYILYIKRCLLSVNDFFFLTALYEGARQWRSSAALWPDWEDASIWTKFTLQFETGHATSFLPKVFRRGPVAPWQPPILHFLWPALTQLKPLMVTWSGVQALPCLVMTDMLWSFLACCCF